ncbi:MAG: peptide deformylase, partial [Anaerolineales bacterium]
DMIETMRAAPGVGLAAPQVGVSQRLIVVEYSEAPEEGEAAGSAPSAGTRPVGTKPLTPKPPQLYVVVNPEIVRRSSETVEGSEGCLSIPGFYGEVERAEWVTVRGLNRRGDPFKLKVHGWLARIFQHEIDHLDGVLFIDRASQVWRIPEGEAAAARGSIEGGPPAAAV